MKIVLNKPRLTTTNLSVEIKDKQTLDQFARKLEKFLLANWSIMVDVEVKDE